MSEAPSPIAETRAPVKSGKYSVRADLSGQQFGRLTAICRLAPPKATETCDKIKWICRCECGAITWVAARKLVDARTRSCGCLRRETMGDAARRHGMSKTNIWERWQCMLQRCHDANSSGFHKYGARGIRVCPRWHTFENFFADMGHAPKGMSIHRKENDGDYSPGNCQWATATEQARNRRSSHFVTFNGETLTLKGWEERLNISDRTLRVRLVRLKWSVERALTTPAKPVIGGRNGR